MNILFMCVANSARSQMAEGLAKQVFGQSAWIESAGSQPKFVHPLASAVLSEVGIDLTTHSSKAFDQLPEKFRANLDYIITLCAEEVCPAVASKSAKRLHWPFPDPAGSAKTEIEQLQNFRKVRDGIRTKLEQLKRELTK
jgi:arsenate reductase (thioredoxin)